MFLTPSISAPNLTEAVSIFNFVLSQCLRATTKLSSFLKDPYDVFCLIRIIALNHLYDLVTP